MRVLVTGATGFTGGRLAQMLAERGDDVVALVRDSSDTSKLEAIGAKVVRGDIRDASAVERAVDGCEVVYHIAALYRSAKHPDQMYHEVNVGGTEHVLRAAELHDVARVVHCSTVGVHGKVTHLPVNECAPFAPGDIYQRTKLEGELRAQAAIERGFPVTIARPAGIYGPGDLRFLKLFTTIQNRRFRMIGPGRVSYHFTFVDDLCRGFMVCAENPEAIGRTYILCGERYHPLHEVVQIVAEAVGVPVPRGSIPVWPVMLAARCCEGVCRPFGVEPPLYRRRLDFFVKDRAFTGARAKKELGFTASVDLIEGFRRTAQWYCERGLLRGPLPDLESQIGGLQRVSTQS